VKYEGIDFRDPEACLRIAFAERSEVLRRIRKSPDKHLPMLKAYYKDHIADFINDWGCTFDPKNVELKLPSLIRQKRRSCIRSRLVTIKFMTQYLVPDFHAAYARARANCKQSILLTSCRSLRMTVATTL